MPDSDNRPDVGQLWRSWLTETERQWNSFFNDIFATDSFGRFLGGYMEIYSGFHRLAAQNVERSLSSLNVPTRSDIVELSERLGTVEERLASIESALNTLAEALGHPIQPASVTQLRPRRTRRPRTQPSQAQ
ncbi:hypothetical protein LCGC14_1030760 [marine sediment metagenome]|uniref:Poly(3-hydroxyalkanoate) polymerase subunit PhaE n=1 Tax=marine sediment metagenome TaxID=412755 RepID=A0A0F9R0K4_9ZZZZ